MSGGGVYKTTCSSAEAAAGSYVASSLEGLYSNTAVLALLRFYHSHVTKVAQKYCNNTTLVQSKGTISILPLPNPRSSVTSGANSLPSTVTQETWPHGCTVIMQQFSCRTAAAQLAQHSTAVEGSFATSQKSSLGQRTHNKATDVTS